MLGVVIFVINLFNAQAITVSPLNPIKGDTVTLTASVTGFSITWTKDSNPLTSCVVSAAVCTTPTPPSIPNSVISVNSGTSESTIVMTDVNQTLNGGSYDVTGASVANVIIHSLPTTVEWKSQPNNNTKVSDGTWKAELPCVFPPASINVEFDVYIEGNKETMNSSSEDVESDLGCESTENTVIATINLSGSKFQDKDVYIIARAWHTLFPGQEITSSQSNQVTFTGGSGTDGKSCDEPLIYVLFLILTLVCVATTFFLVIWFNLRFPNIGKVVLIIIGVVVDLLFEIILLWGIEYGSDFRLFKSDINCPVVIIGVVCHVVGVVVEIVKVVIQYLYTEELGARIFVCYLPDPEIKKVRKSAAEEHPSHTLLPANGDGRKGLGAANQSKTVEKPEDILLFMHFTVPLGYTVNKWVTEENASIENNPKYVPNDRGTLLIKSATEKDNGIYQGILTSDVNEQRVNAVLHVTGQKSANLIINPLIWRQVKTKKLKKICDLKEIRQKVSRDDIDSIPMKKEEGSEVNIKSVRWVLNGKHSQTLSSYKDGDDSVPHHTVTRNQPVDEYHCTVEFSNNKSHVYIFIVKFTGVRSGNTPQSSAMHNNKVDTVDDVVGVPTILSTRREETISSLPPLRHTATTAQDRQLSDRLPVDENNLHPVTARSSQSAKQEDNL